MVVLVVVQAKQGEVVVGCSFCVVMGATRKKFLPPKMVSWGHLFRPIATQHISWEVVFTHRNELLHDPREPSLRQNAPWELFSTPRKERRPRLKSLSALPPLDRPLQWKGWIGGLLCTRHEDQKDICFIDICSLLTKLLKIQRNDSTVETYFVSFIITTS